MTRRSDHQMTPSFFYHWLTKIYVRIFKWPDDFFFFLFFSTTFVSSIEWSLIFCVHLPNDWLPELLLWKALVNRRPIGVEYIKCLRYDLLRSVWLSTFFWITTLILLATVWSIHLTISFDIKLRLYHSLITRKIYFEL